MSEEISSNISSFLKLLPLVLFGLLIGANDGYNSYTFEIGDNLFLLSLVGIIALLIYKLLMKFVDIKLADNQLQQKEK